MRLLIVVIELWRNLTPVRDWQRGATDERQLLAADRALAWVQLKFPRDYLLGWVAVPVVAMVLGYVGIPSRLPIGAVEVICGVLIMCAAACAVPVLMRSILDSMLLETKIEICTALRERVGVTDPASVVGDGIGRALLINNFGVFGGAIFGLATVVVSQRAHSARELQLVEQAGRARVVATQLRTGEQIELEPGVRVVESAQLPEPLARVRDAEPGGESLQAVDRHAQIAKVAIALDGDRWVVAEAEIEHELGWVFVFLFVFVPLAFVPVVVGGAALNRSISTTLRQLDDATRQIAEGGDVRGMQRLVPLRRDELGALARNFNRMVDVLDELATTATTIAGGDLRVEVRGQGDLPDAFREMVARLHEIVRSIRATARELAATAVELRATTQDQDHSVDRQSTRMLEVSEAVAMLAQAADDISNTAAEVLDNADEAVATADAMVAKIGELSVEAGSIGELLELIREVADRSDLLALNGALEATRAGEAGRGFALVAAEMRRLAERVTGTVGDVRERVASIQAATSATVRATEGSRELASSTAAAARRISDVTRKQSSETEQVSIKVFEIAEVMITAVDATKQTLAAAEGLRAQASELERLTGQFELRESPSGRPGPTTIE